MGICSAHRAARYTGSRQSGSSHIVINLIMRAAPAGLPVPLRYAARAAPADGPTATRPLVSTVPRERP